MEQTTLTWTLSQLHRQSDFPYRVLITSPDHPKPLLDLRAKGRWPHKGRNIYCIRPKEENDLYTELERVAVISAEKKGAKFSVVLNREKERECEFISTFKPFKRKPGAKENIYWRTAEALTANRPRVNIPVHHQESEITIAVSNTETYPWQFPTYTVTETELPAGDYALIENSQIVALIKRETFAGMIEHFNNIEALHRQLSELRASCPNAAFLIEANYSDFLNPSKQDLIKTADCGDLIAQLQPQHPTLPIVYTGNRKLAIEWAHNYFHALALSPNTIEANETIEPEKKYQVPDVTIEQPEPATGIFAHCHLTPADQAILDHAAAEQPTPPTETAKEKAPNTLLDKLPYTFTIEDFCQIFPNVPVAMIKKLLTGLKKQGLLTYKRGKNTVWSKTEKKS